MASDGKNLRLYQAVVDARKLLDELSDPETSVREHIHCCSFEICYFSLEHIKPMRICFPNFFTVKLRNLDFCFSHLSHLFIFL